MNSSSLSDFDFDLDDLDLPDCEYVAGSSIFAVADDLYNFRSHDANCAVAVPVDEDSAHERKRKASTASCASVELCKMPRPRILKRDFRREFPIAWASVFNSCDYDYMLQHQYTYYDPDTVLVRRDLRAPSILCPDAIPGMKVCYGPKAIPQFWFGAMNMAPDLVCTLKHTCLKVRADGTSTIQCCFTLTGTRVITPPESSDIEANEQLAAYTAALAAQSHSRATISQTAAAVAAVAPEKVAALLQGSIATSSSATSASPSVSLENSLQDFDDSLSLSDVSILDWYMDAPLTNAAAHKGTVAEPSRPLEESAQRSTGSALPAQQGCMLLAISNNEASPLLMRHQVGHVDKGPPAAPTAPARLTKSAASGQRRKRAKGLQDWQSLGEEAYKAGSIGSSSSSSSVSLSTTAGSAPQSDASPLLSSPAQKIVLTGGIDCICSFEIQLNAEHRVMSMVLNFIT